jgi:hypothetical protein
MQIKNKIKIYILLGVIVFSAGFVFTCSDSVLAAGEEDSDIYVVDDVQDSESTESIELDSDAIELELIQQVQNPTNLEFEYTLRIKSNVETQRLRLHWEFAEGYAKAAKGETLTDALDISQGEEIYVTKIFEPIRAGYEELRVRAIVFFGPDPVSDYYSFTNTEFFINEDLEIDPDRSEYQVAKGLMSFLSITKTLAFFGVIIALISVGYWRFRLWLDSE